MILLLLRHAFSCLAGGAGAGGGIPVVGGAILCLVASGADTAAGGLPPALAGIAHTRPVARLLKQLEHQSSIGCWSAYSPHPCFTTAGSFHDPMIDRSR